MSEDDAKPILLKRYKIHWLDGRSREIEGTDITDAFAKAGYTRATLSLFNWIEEIKEKEEGQTNA